MSITKILALSALLLSATACRAADKLLAWDGVDSSLLDHYLLCVSDSNGALLQTISVPKTATQATVSLASGQMYSAVVYAVDTSNVMGQGSNVLLFQVFDPGLPILPAAPANLRPGTHAWTLQTTNALAAGGGSPTLSNWISLGTIIVTSTGPSQFLRLVPADPVP